MPKKDTYGSTEYDLVREVGGDEETRKSNSRYSQHIDNAGSIAEESRWISGLEMT